jgi:uncharacterized Zn finger protein (UPF0148 family)
VNVFDDVLRKARQLERGVQVPIELELDNNGYLDRVCPSDECGTNFKVMFEDWRDIVRDEEVFCPLCRHDAKSTEWNTPEQAEYIQQAATAYVQKQLGQAFRSDARRFNRSQDRNSFIKMSMSYKPGHIPVLVPANAADIMTQEFTCDECNCRYASIGAAFFCPACGHNSVLDTFANSVQTVQKTLAAIPAIRDALTDSADENVAEDSIRHICENGLVKIVSSFQRYAEACFQKLPNAGSFTVRRNLFQNLSESDAIWRGATGTGYTDLLDNNEYEMLSLYFQQRHVLAHLDGIVDQQYIDRSNDHRFDVGQRLIVKESNVSDLATVIEKLAAGLVALT